MTRLVSVRAGVALALALLVAVAFLGGADCSDEGNSFLVANATSTVEVGCQSHAFATPRPLGSSEDVLFLTLDETCENQEGFKFFRDQKNCTGKVVFVQVSFSPFLLPPYALLTPACLLPSPPVLQLQQDLG